MVELPILVTRLDGKEDILIFQTYLVDADFRFFLENKLLKIGTLRLIERRRF